MGLTAAFATRPRPTGFTLVEMLLVLAIVGIAATLAFAGIGRYLEVAQERDWAQRTVRELTKLRQKAMLSNRPILVEIRLTQNEIVQVSGDASLPLVSLPERYAYERSTGEDPVSATIAADIPLLAQMAKSRDTSFETDSDALRLAFYPDGSSTGIRFDLVTPGESRYVLRVYRLTGRIELLLPSEQIS